MLVHRLHSFLLLCPDHRASGWCTRGHHTAHRADQSTSTMYEYVVMLAARAAGCPLARDRRRPRTARAGAASPRAACSTPAGEGLGGVRRHELIRRGPLGARAHAARPVRRSAVAPPVRRCGSLERPEGAEASRPVRRKKRGGGAHEDLRTAPGVRCARRSRTFAAYSVCARSEHRPTARGSRVAPAR